MKILVNMSIIVRGGGLQVALSLINEFVFFPDHKYVYLISSSIEKALDKSKYPENVTFYTINPSPSHIFRGWYSIKKIRSIENAFGPDVFFTLFGPSYFRPKTRHLCGFALPQYVYRESPYFSVITVKEKLVLFLKGTLKLRSLRNHCDYWVTETNDVSHRLSLKLNVPKEKVFTVGNIYNGIYDRPSEWKKIPIEGTSTEQGGFKLITISSFYVHKNLAVIPRVIDYLIEKHPQFEFGFYLTIEGGALSNLTDRQKSHISFLGKVNIEHCPYLYEQANALFMPTFLECFTVSYLEAMKMNKPILTSDLPFAHDICADAAVYFDPLSPADIGEKIILLATDQKLQNLLISAGSEHIKVFGTARDRARRYLNILSEIC